MAGTCRRTPKAQPICVSLFPLYEFAYDPGIACPCRDTSLEIRACGLDGHCYRVFHRCLLLRLAPGRRFRATVLWGTDLPPHDQQRPACGLRQYCRIRYQPVGYRRMLLSPGALRAGWGLFASLSPSSSSPTMRHSFGYFLLVGGVERKRALQAAALAVVFALPAILWVSHLVPHWLPEYHANLLAPLRAAAATMPASTPAAASAL